MRVAASMEGGHLPPPLCRGYSVVVAKAMSLKTLEPRTKCVMYWGLGALPSGQFEVLGIWMPDPDISASRFIRDDLRLRGVERIGSFLGLHSDAIQGTSRSPSVALEVPAECVPPPDKSRGHRRRRSLRKTCDVAAEIARRLDRALALHGPFRHESDAASFLSRRMVRLDLLAQSFGRSGREVGAASKSTAGR
jgi:hypothetical protein